MIFVTRPSLPELDNYLEYLKKLWKNKWITNNGELAILLERNLKEYLKIEDLILVSNGTIALQMAVKTSVSEGDIITTPFTFIATTNAIVWEGCNPIFADINPETFNIDPEDVKRKITRKTRGILAVHVYGNPSYVEELEQIAAEHKLKLIFDGAHSFGVESNNQSVYNYGDVSTLSFHATKIFNTIEGGAIVTRDKELAKRLRLLRDHGIKSEEEFIGNGTNAKMNEFQAAMGLCNLEHVNHNVEIRKKLYNRYLENLKNRKEIRFQKLEATKYNYSYMPILLESKERRDLLANKLSKNGVSSRKYFYPLTIESNYFKQRKSYKTQKAMLRVAYNISLRILCLPLYPELRVEEVDKITHIIEQVVN